MKNQTKEQDKATARPWRLEAWSHYKGQHVLHDSRFLMADDPEHEGESVIIAKFRDGRLEDRTFVLKAVNSHDALVEALDAMVNYYSDMVITDDENPIKHDQMIEKARAVLRLAKGEA